MCVELRLRAENSHHLENPGHITGFTRGIFSLFVFTMVGVVVGLGTLVVTLVCINVSLCLPWNILLALFSQ